MFSFFYIIILLETENGRWQVLFFSAKERYFEQEFGREVRGYSKVEVDEFWTMSSRTTKLIFALVKSLRQEIAELKEELSRKPESAPVQAEPLEMTATTSMTNFDVLKRLNRLEKEVFGKQILDNSDL